jgi:hypothetical protein
MRVRLGERVVTLSFSDFPWFQDAPVAGVLHVERPQPHHLYWPDLDIDLEVESILNPRRYPLVSRDKPVRSKPRVDRTPGSRTRSKRQSQRGRQ